MNNKEIDRIKNVYARYKNDHRYNSLYHPFGINTYPNLVFIREFVKYFKNADYRTLKGQKILNVGFGSINIFLLLMRHRAEIKDLYGIDLIFERVKQTHKINFNLINGDAQVIPFTNEIFDILIQSYLFSSILDDKVCCNIAEEMLRVLKKDGIIIWYDCYGDKMISENTRGFSRAQIRKFFPDCEFYFKKIVLTGWLQHRLNKINWFLSDLVSFVFPFLNCMDFVIIKKK